MPPDTYVSLFNASLDGSIDGAYSSFVAWAVPALVVVGTFVFFVTVFLIGQRIRQEDPAAFDQTLDELDETLYETPTPSGRRRLVKPMQPMQPVIVPLAGALDSGALPASQMVFVQPERQPEQIADETPEDPDQQPTQVVRAVSAALPSTPFSPVPPVVYPVIQGPFGTLVLDRLRPISRDMLN
jgi:hypothetical protein